MKNQLLRFCAGFVLLVFLMPSSAWAVYSKRLVPSQTLQIYAIDGNHSITVAQFSQLTIHDLQHLSSRKLTLEEKVTFKLTQRAINKKLKRGEPYDFDSSSSYRFNLGGFLLGFFLGPIGVLLALLFGRSAFRSSLIGLLCLIIASLIGWFVF